MYIKPLRKTYDPKLKDFLPLNGREVEFNQYWAKRLARKSVIEIKSEIKEVK